MSVTNQAALLYTTRLLPQLFAGTAQSLSLSHTQAYNICISVLAVTTHTHCLQATYCRYLKILFFLFKFLYWVRLSGNCKMGIQG